MKFIVLISLIVIIGIILVFGDKLIGIANIIASLLQSVPRKYLTGWRLSSSTSGGLLTACCPATTEYGDNQIDGCERVTASDQSFEGCPTYLAEQQVTWGQTPININAGECWQYEYPAQNYPKCAFIRVYTLHYCGNEICDSYEYCGSCEKDCGSCVEPTTSIRTTTVSTSYTTVSTIPAVSTIPRASTTTIQGENVLSAITGVISKIIDVIVSFFRGLLK